jgi:hypothetical protein
MIKEKYATRSDWVDSINRAPGVDCRLKNEFCPDQRALFKEMR